MARRDLSVLIPARNEMFLAKTIDSVLANIEANTEVIAVCDGYWPDPPLLDHPRVVVIHHTESVGQRAATNEAAWLSQAKYIMKADAHCAFDKGFDVKLMRDCDYDWTVIPRMYNLHAFDWLCKSCQHRVYQGPKPENCEECKSPDIVMDVVWKPRIKRRTDFARFDNTMHFQYWQKYDKRPESVGDIADVMSFVGACWFMHRERYLELEGLDESHGSWGQVGTEISCKSWLSGGRLVVNKKTWFSHMFRTNGAGFSFPYHISGNAQERARRYSRDLWLKDRWPLARLPLKWLVDKFAPVPGWEEEGVQNA